MVKLKQLLLLSMFFILGCKELYRDENLALPRQNYISNNLKLNGIYYAVGENSEYANSIFLYENGLLLVGDSFHWPEFDTAIKKMQGEQWAKYTKKNKINWGHFLVNHSKIIYEIWVPPSGGGIPTYIYEGEILNDTTFKIIQNRPSRSKKWSPHPILYRFRAVDIKPDSLNHFVW